MTVLAGLLGAVAFVVWPAPRSRPHRAEAADRSSSRRRGTRLNSRPTFVLPLAAGGAGAGALLALFGLSALPVAVVGGVGLYWVAARLPAAVVDPGSDPALPLALELTAAALRAGRPVADAVRLAAPAGGPVLRARLEVVSGLLALGEDPIQAWAALGSSGVLEDVARAAARSSDSGVRLADTCTQAAADVRSRLRTLDTVRAARAGTHVLAPLGLCFLPAFICLGVAPVVMGILAGALTVG